MKIAILFSRHSEALFNINSKRTFGGDSVQLYNIAKELSNYKDIKTYSLIPSFEEINFPDEDNFNLVKTFDENDFLVIKIFKMHQVFKKVQPEVIVQRGLTPYSCLLAIYSNLKKIKFVFMFAHDLEAEGKYQSSQKNCWLFKILLKNSYKLITQNTYQKRFIATHYQINSVNLRSGFPLPNNKKPNNKYILWVARSDSWKNPYLFIYLAKKISQEKFVMICPYSKNISKDQYQDIKNQAKKVKNLQFIEFVKFTDVNEYFKNAKLLINTSDYEGFSQTFIQALINSVPIVSLNSNPNEFLEKYNCGYCSRGDIKVLEERISIFLSNKLLQKSLSDNSYKYAQTNHDIKDSVLKLLDTIE